MKKNIIIISTLIIGIITGFTCAHAYNQAKFSSKFVKHFKNCDSYQETTQSEYEGMNFKTERNIIGWRNGYCRFTETISSKDGAYKLNCSFTDLQVEELYKSMKNRSKTPQEYTMDIFALKTNPKTGKETYEIVDKMTIKGNSAYVTWTKYENNPYFCIPQKLK